MQKIIAVDFDGTLCEDAYPSIGSIKHETFLYCQMEKAKGAILILWTCRSGKALLEAEQWLALTGLEFDYVNVNAAEAIAKFGEDPRKIYADEYIDDKFLCSYKMSEEVGKSLANFCFCEKKK
jgi:hydroxymethylpyrimidine pyrophosphatase-like HAD family hydrolase